MTLANPTPEETFLCLEIRHPLESADDVIRNTLEENPQNALGSTGILPFGQDSVENEPLHLAVNIKKHWHPGRTLSIKFLSGSPDLHAKVEKYADLWLMYANLKFNWLPMDAPKADIRIDFQVGGGSKSLIGVDALLVTDQTQQTMNLEINLKNPDEYIRRKVLHEFGHVLGCEHEHQSPLASFEWNKEVIYAELGRPPNSWSKSKIDRNVINRLEAKEISASIYDPDSIMLYQYPASWFKNSGGVGTKNNTTLSTRDREWIKQTYPPWSSDIGYFSTLRTKDMPFEPAYAAPPRVAVGLSWLDLDCSQPLSFLAKAEGITEDHFTVTIAPSDPRSRIVSATCSWIEASASDSEIQLGHWTIPTPTPTLTPESPTISSQNNTLSTTIKFPYRFDGGEAPTVLAFLSELKMSKDHPWRVKTYITDASPFKFKLHLDIGPGTDLRGATVTWVAFPASKQGMLGGTFATDDIPGPENAGVVDFSKARFHMAPAVMMAISGLDFENGRNLRLRISHSGLSNGGMAWHLDSLGDSLMNTATGVFVAVCPPEGNE
ncbi:metalloprotease [Immersiella caudata]|uniref:Metalloprotease n=1 Tax=Immersiella caudata TaxID=314043 RepID=A0AA40BZ96_9PEZI|nr:metalloprotease [Immersiella caudata]